MNNRTRFPLYDKGHDKRLYLFKLSCLHCAYKIGGSIKEKDINDIYNMRVCPYCKSKLIINYIHDIHTKTTGINGDMADE